jgi:hypothetical protein
MLYLRKGVTEMPHNKHLDNLTSKEYTNPPDNEAQEKPRPWEDEMPEQWTFLDRVVATFLVAGGLLSCLFVLWLVIKVVKFLWYL